MPAMTVNGSIIGIGAAARATGLSVRNVRFYADAGLVTPARRSEAGYRMFDAEGVERLELVRTLRELGLDLPTIRRVLAGDATVPAVAATHAAALDAQITLLRQRRAVLRTVARSDHHNPREVAMMTRLAQLTDFERKRIVEDFLQEVFAGVEVDPEIAGRMRSVGPDLPDDPTPEQVKAWVELAELVQDPDFRARIRGMTERAAAERRAEDPELDPPDWGSAARRVAERAGGALEAGIDPSAPEAAPVADELARAFAPETVDASDAGYRRRLADRLADGTDARAERYWQLMARINGWSETPSQVPAWEWLVAALRAHAA